MGIRARFVVTPPPFEVEIGPKPMVFCSCRAVRPRATESEGGGLLVQAPEPARAVRGPPKLSIFDRFYKVFRPGGFPCGQ